MKDLDVIEMRIESLKPNTVVKLDTLLKGIKNKAKVRETAIMLLNKYGIEYKE